MALNPDQLYVRPEPQEQIDAGLAITPYEQRIGRASCRERV